MGLPSFPGPWREPSLSPSPSQEAEKSERQRKNKREMLEQQRRENEQKHLLSEESDRRQRSYIAALTAEKRRVNDNGESMDLDGMASLLHMGMDALSGGGGSMITGIVAEHAIKGESGPSEEKENAPTEEPPLLRPLRND